MATWKLAGAKARFSALVEKALNRKAAPRKNLVAFLDRSPLKGSGVRIERLRDQPRDFEL